jgi:hypothetical protein
VRFSSKRHLAAVATLALVAAGLAALLMLIAREAGVDDGDRAPSAVPAPTEPEPTATEAPITELAGFRWPLTGLPVDSIPQRPALIVKVSNSPEARPQTGLEQADLVLEELAEGGVTRYIAIYHSHVPEIAGPVRSARPVDVQIVAGFSHPGFAFSGARAEVRGMLAVCPAALITESDPAFFRDDGRYASHPVAPHNLFVRGAAAMESTIAAGAQPLESPGWTFGEPTVASTEPGTAVEIAMSDSFRTSWTYDPGTGLYRRAQNGATSLVTGSGRIGAANLVVVQARHYVGPTGYPETDVLGTRAAVVFRDGLRYTARWSKPASDEPWALLTAEGEPFALKPGATWIHLPVELPR